MKNTIKDIQKKFFEDLIKMGFSKERAFKTTSVFLLSWLKTYEGKQPNAKEYSKAVSEFLSSFKQSM